MDIQTAQQKQRLFAKRSAALTVLFAIAVATNLVLGLVVMNGSRIVLVPTLPGDVAIDPNGRVDAEYLEDMTRDAAWLFLNKTPETAAYFERRAQRLMDPVHFEAVKVQLEKDSAKSEATHSSQAFFPADFFEDPANLYSEVRGRLVIMQGQQVLDDQSKVYALHWTKTGTLLRLASIAEIDPKDAKGDDVKPRIPGDTQ